MLYIQCRSRIANHDMTRFFQFEADFVDSLRCIPMQVRYKLDTCGIKLKLPEWNQFSQEDRQALIDRPCNTPKEIQEYRQWLQNLVVQYTSKPASELPVEDNPDWMNVATVPPSIGAKASEFGVTLSSEQWANLPPIERFALIKLSRSSHENRNFLPALKEFNLVE